MAKCCMYSSFTTIIVFITGNLDSKEGVSEDNSNQTRPSVAPITAPCAAVAADPRSS